MSGCNQVLNMATLESDFSMTLLIRRNASQGNIRSRNNIIEDDDDEEEGYLVH